MPGFEVFGEEEKQQALEVFDTGVLFRYEFVEQRKGVYKVREFEQAFAKYTGAAHAQAVTSGTAALKVALIALGVGIGDEVITQGFTFVATWEAILDVGAVPVFTEVDQTLNMDPTDLEKKITSKTRAIIPVHMLGAPARIVEIKAIADKYGVPVLEDTAQAPGARLNGQHLGTFGHFGTFSFDSVKTITTGEGGMVICNDEELWRNCSEYQDHGHDHAVNPGGRGGEGRRFIGFNYRMMELQGAIGLAQLAKLDSIVASQQKNKAILKEAASKIAGVSFRVILDEQGDSATFLAFMLPDKEQAAKVNQVLRDNKAGAINFGENSWHFYPSWEHLLGGKTLCKNGWPFDSHCKRRVIYDPEALPASVELMSRTLVYQVPVNLSDTQRETMLAALAKAAAL
ncbi:DegT/DnrJ/EryC1/StrS family aminotransferase [Desulfobulbus sp. US1]|uniref:dTDP-4-amino-4,6-dideoxygalactose transaminase n=1 Tax=Candidatus Electrothrix communis TaxID=1859133 RepID=A0A3S3RD11_9BACT|nr:DegT/DnrJ/EryC1/StrS family aminotransferase [Desulfobulbus sp. US4]MCW5207654.1 DegT/DnrJ/EryC1/StrS family aminotransferase [Desulfobulbus sp. US2]MCW5209182.1 DegT/DnrJ/EryC1/StrS family aminotransferase [Desulfobulbus sp. US1]MCW5210157.1 DegT/DnrJ/EryC1/StrS family aminotransferase [Desulfobulbus sp. N3]RWX49871.1 dTDP-4-amino-4,6-dideoxygalactose transaminase [Candidatus Electrothrix communis]